MNDNELIYWMALSRVNGIGPSTFHKLLQKMGSPQAVFEATDETLKNYSLKDDTLKSLRQLSLNSVKQLIEKTRSQKIDIITSQDSAYPQSLKSIAQAPPLLFVRGNINSLNSGDWLGVVGSRNITDYGVKACRDLVRDLVVSGVRIVSGFASGVDIEAHLTCLNHKGITVGVLGHGLDTIFPAEHKKYVGPLLEAGGALVSEFPIETEIHPRLFPRRNRLISGLSRGVLVVEANRRSGSLITADYALEEGRDVFAVPGSIFSGRSEGCHDLIQKGAKLVGKAGDILSEWQCEIRTLAPHVFENPDEKVLFTLLQESEMDMDSLIGKAGLPAHRVSMLLTKMEMEGRIRARPGRRFQSI